MEKLKENKKTLIITSILVLLPIVIGLVLWDKLPDKIATHFDGNGVADGWSNKGFAVFGMPLFILAVHLICSIATSADPKNQRINDKIFKLILWICPVVSWFGNLSIYAYALEFKYNTATLAMILVGIIFIVIGNYLPKCRQNYTVGIKLPWTLHDEENWNRTHRFAGKLWMFGGIFFSILAITGAGSTWLLPAIMIVIAIVPMIYSFLYYLKHK
jgi:uncharacterized membrane protein